MAKSSKNIVDKIKVYLQIIAYLVVISTSFVSYYLAVEGIARYAIIQPSLVVAPNSLDTVQVGAWLISASDNESAQASQFCIKVNGSEIHDYAFSSNRIDSVIAVFERDKNMLKFAVPELESGNEYSLSIIHKDKSVTDYVATLEKPNASNIIPISSAVPARREWARYIFAFSLGCIMIMSSILVYTKLIRYTVKRLTNAR